MNKKLENKLSSREVSEMMEMEHKHLIRKIDAINLDFRKSNIGFSKYWRESTYKVEGQTREYREFLITKRGCEFLANKTTGTKGNLFTDKYMDRFSQMEEVIKNNIPVEIEKICDRPAFIITLLTNLPNDDYKNRTVSKVLDFISLKDANNIQIQSLIDIKPLLDDFMQLPNVIIKETENGIAVDGVKFFDFFSHCGYSKSQILSRLDTVNLIHHSSCCRTAQVRVGNGYRVRVVIIKIKPNLKFYECE